MTDHESMLIEHACNKLIVRLSHALDSPQNPEPILDCWAEDGIWESPAGQVQGKEAIRKMLATIPRSLNRHLAVGFLVNALDSTHAEGTGRLIFYKASKVLESGTGEIGGASIITDYSDRYIKTPLGWRFAHRVTTYVLHRTS